MRGVLLAMHGRVCAYCERPLPANDRGDVEHFRPKSHYWWLAYEFTNYFLACRKCNSTCKRDEFPLAGGQAGVMYEDRHLMHEELRLIVDPSLDPVEDWLPVVLEGESVCELAVGIEDTTDPAAAERIGHSIAFFGLNLGVGLVEARLTVRKRAIDLLSRLDVDPVDMRSREKLQRIASRYEPHSCVARQILRQYEPALQPMPSQEVGWLLEDLVRELLNSKVRHAKARKALLLARSGSEAKAINRRKQEVERERDELYWAIAVILKEPPAGMSVDVVACLRSANLLTTVQRFCNRLVSV